MKSKQNLIAIILLCIFVCIFLLMEPDEMTRKSLLVFGALYILFVFTVKTKYWPIALAEFTIVLFVSLMNGLIWKNHDLIFFSTAMDTFFIGLSGAALLITQRKLRKGKESLQ